MMKNLEEKEVLNLLEDSRAFIENGHFVLNSGRHSSEYENEHLLYPNTSDVSVLGEQIARKFTNNGAGNDIDVVVGATGGSAILAHCVAEHLSVITGYERRVTCLYADFWREGYLLRHEYSNLVKDKRVLVVDGILATSKKAQEVMRAVREVGGRVFGLGVVLNRSGLGRMELEVPKFEALATKTIARTWHERDCPLCASGTPINTEFGYGKAFLSHKKLVQGLSGIDSGAK